MIIGDLRDGMTIGTTGVKVVTARRDGNYCKITLSTGTMIRLPKSAHVADLFVGHVPAQSLMSSVPRLITDVRASSREWRGERDGVRGETLISRSRAWDARGPRPRRLSER